MADESQMHEDVRLGRLEDFIGLRFRRIQSALTKRFAVAISHYGLRSGQFTTIAIIAANPGISQNAVAREARLDKSQIGVIINDLEDRGWAERRRSDADMRRKSLYLTLKGEQELESMFGILQQTELPIEAGFSRAEFNMLLEWLDRVNALCMLETRP